MMSRYTSNPVDQALPLPILLACAGLCAITVVVIGAVSLRGMMAGTPREAKEAAPAAIASSAASGSPRRAAPAASSGEMQQSTTARERRAELNRDLQAGRYDGFIARLEALLNVDPAAAEDRDIRTAIVDVVLMRIMVGGEEHAEKLFGLLQHRMGTTGIDILYELVTTRGGSLAAKRAAELLADEAVRARGTAALRVAYDLRVSSCAGKGELFERAMRDGDKRALDQLGPLSQNCGRRSRGCCLYSKDPRLKAALEALKARVP